MIDLWKEHSLNYTGKALVTFITKLLDYFVGLVTSHYKSRELLVFVLELGYFTMKDDVENQQETRRPRRKLTQQIVYKGVYTITNILFCEKQAPNW